ncbi:contractile injection system protein, VgrG/Pvc8 family [Rodentibacter caecimuris]|uniref:contractile injection system protein, VgrG/Pvc8 family n=1 Tax=Rodentibacter caecimuris TaxID=1796644 RepID=UPI0013A08845|nr:contractile injection system protein, VgrG/Pvc8 family [Rodentibacter heylii]QIA77374.1 hypothetical protein FEE42_08435 [Rodentibacter heylii]
MDKAATFTFWKGDKTVRYVNGIVTGFGLGKSGFVRTYYQMVVEPALVSAALQSDSRIFQHQNSEKIIRTLLQKNRVDNMAFEPLPSDWEQEYCVQYRKTDLAFIECLATDEQGRPFSRYRLESALALSETAQATGDDMRVIPGYGFNLEGHINPAFNQDWFIVRVEHQGYQTGVMEEEAGEEGNRYENKLFLIPHHTPWRSPQKPRPIIRGTQVAHVVGPEGEEIYCDEWGRVKLQFPWDRLGNFDEHSSCRVIIL